MFVKFFKKTFIILTFLIISGCSIVSVGYNRLPLLAIIELDSIFDLNEAMGGWGSIYSWFKKGLTLKDKLHFTEQGYSLQGNLFTLSLLEAYNSINFHDSINLNQIRSTVKDSMASILKNSKNDSLIKILERHNKKKSSGSKNSTNKIHIVKKGDTASKLCRIYKISLNTIFSSNHLNKKSILKIGEKIIISK